MNLRAVGLVLILLWRSVHPAFAARVELSREQITAAMDTIAADEIQLKSAPALSIGVQVGDVAVVKGYGTADIENNVPATEKTVFRIGSTTKQFTSAAIMQLVEQGKLKLDDELTNFLPDYPTQGKKVTVHHLLNHTSGIKSFTSVLKFGEIKRSDLTHDQVIELFKAERFDFEPGTRHRYNNSGYYLLGVVIEKVSGQSYADYLKEHLFAKAGLTQTYYLEEEPIIPHRAQGYGLLEGEFINDEMISMKIPFGAGALGSTSGDLLKWQRALMSGKIVSPESYAKMITPTAVAVGPKVEYGYGMQMTKWRGLDMIGHGGAIEGFTSDLRYFPESDVTVAVLANCQAANARLITTRIAEKVLGLPEIVVKNIALTGEESDRYVGKYQFGTETGNVYKTREKLMVLMPTGPPFAILYQGDDTFISERDRETKLTFTKTGEKVIGFTLEWGGGKTVKVKAARVDEVQK